MNDPESYEKAKTLELKYIDQHMPLLIDALNWKLGEKIMDYGCGPGSVMARYLVPIAEKFQSIVIGVDVSPEMVEFATEKFSGPHAGFVVGNIMANKSHGQVEDKVYTMMWPLHDQKFDKIFCIHALTFIQNYQEFFKRLHSQLNDGGELAFAVPYAPFHKIHHALGDHPKWCQYMAETKNVRATWPFDDTLDFPVSVKLALKSLEMELIDFSSYQTTMLFRDVHEFTNFIMATNLGAKNVPLELQDELRQEIAEQGAKICGVPISSEPFPVKLNHCRFVAQKI